MIYCFIDADGSPVSARSLRAAAKGEAASGKQKQENTDKQKALEEREAILADRETGGSIVQISSSGKESTEPTYLVSVAKGLVVTHQQSGRPSDTVMERVGDRDEEQNWIVEGGDEPDTIALKNVANNKYLTGEGKHYGKVTTADDKRLWRLEHDGDAVRPPGAYRLSLVGSPKVFLRHINGSPKVAMHEWTVFYPIRTT